MDLNIQRGKQKKPRRTVLYGCHGIGKSTWASQWPSAVFIPTEEGINDLEVDSFPLAKTLMEAWMPLIDLAEKEHDYKTVVIDSADWLERLIWSTVCEASGKKFITDFAYGKGYGEAAKRFENYLRDLEKCRARGMHIVIVAHAQVARFESPDTESYDRYTPKLHRDTSAMLQEWADEVLFATYEVFTAKSEEGFGRTRAIAVGDGRRILKTTEKPSHNAKNRLGLPDEMSLDFSEYVQFLQS